MVGKHAGTHTAYFLPHVITCHSILVTAKKRAVEVEREVDDPLGISDVYIE